MEPKIVVITGAASGIGASVAGKFADLGAHLILLDRSDMPAAKLASLRQAAAAVECYRVDLASPAEVSRFTAELNVRHKRIDVLVNNAGIHKKLNGNKRLATEIDDASWNEHVAVNLTAAFMLCRDLFSLLSNSQAGRVVNITSRAGRTLSPMAGAHYSASKAGLIGLTRVLASEWAQYGITVNSVAPGPIATGLASSWDPGLARQHATGIPLGRFGSPDEVANVVVFLASAEASYVTGAAYDVNGGTFAP